MSQLYEGLAEIMEVSVSEIVPDFSLAAPGWDSLAIISCVALIDEVFGHLVAGSALSECRTVADIERLVPQSVAA